jgi:hypothetical protein
MAVTDFADAAAAITAGYRKTQIDRGATAAVRFATQLDKPVIPNPNAANARPEGHPGWAAVRAAPAPSIS